MKLRKIMTGLLAATMAVGSMAIASAANTIYEVDFAQYSDVADVPVPMGNDGNCVLTINNGVLEVTERADFKRGPTFYFSDLVLETGKTYTITAKAAITGDLVDGTELWIQLMSDGEYYGDKYYTAAPVSAANTFYDLSYTFTYDESMFTTDGPRIRIKMNEAAGNVSFSMSEFKVVEGTGEAAVEDTSSDDAATQDTSSDDTLDEDTSSDDSTDSAVQETTADEADTVADNNTNTTDNTANTNSNANSNANNTTGNTNQATNASKGSANTGIAGVATIAGLAVIAVGAVVVSKKRK